MKLAFVVTEVPPSLYYSGEGKCQSVVIPVAIPDEFFPNERELQCGKNFLERLVKENKALKEFFIEPFEADFKVVKAESRSRTEQERQELARGELC